MILLKEFTKEEIPRAIAKWYESTIGEAYEPFEILEKLRNGQWLVELEEGCKSNSYTPPHWNS